MELPFVGEFFKEHSEEKKFILFFVSVLCFLRTIGGITKRRVFYMKKLEDLIAMNLRTSVYERIFQIKKLGFSRDLGPVNHKTVSVQHLSAEELQKFPKQWADTSSHFYSETVNRNILIQKSISDVNTITNGITMNAFFLMRGIVFATGGISMILYNFPQLLVYTSIYLVFFSLRSNMFNRKLQTFSKEHIKSVEKISAFLGEGLSNGHCLRQRQNANFFQYIFNSHLKNTHDQVLKLASVTGSYFRFLETFGIGLIVGILSYGSYLISIGALASEEILLSLYAVYGTMGLRSINNAISEFKLKAGVLDTLEEFLGAELTSRFDETNEGKLNAYCSKIEDHYKNLKETDEGFLASFTLDSLRQNDQTRPVLEAVDSFLSETSNPISLDLSNIRICLPNENETVGKSDESMSPKVRKVLSKRTLETDTIYSLSGKSGTGKTSVMKLILGSNSIAEGQIEFYPKKPLKSVSIYYMPQTTHLFSKNILFNILATNLPLVAHLKESEFSFEQVATCLIGLVHDCLRRANLHNKVDLLLLDEETQNLSGGEKQRVSLAGMLFSHADLVLIDEGTASLDHFNVQIVSPVLKEYLSKRLSIVISHDSQFLDYLVEPQNKIILSAD